jgi:NADPH:quinone reductase-like Zn-dependent oxidoreductase
MLSNSWVVEDFYPIDYIPTGVRLTAYSGEATDLPGEVLQDYLDSAAQDHRLIPLDRVFSLDQIGAAHEYMEQDRATGKIVVIP